MQRWTLLQGAMCIDEIRCFLDDVSADFMIKSHPTRCIEHKSWVWRQFYRFSIVWRYFHQLQSQSLIPGSYKAVFVGGNCAPLRWLWNPICPTSGFCDEVLLEEPGNVKALYRKADALGQLLQTDCYRQKGSYDYTYSLKLELEHDSRRYYIVIREFGMMILIFVCCLFTSIHLCLRVAFCFSVYSVWATELNRVRWTMCMAWSRRGRSKAAAKRWGEGHRVLLQAMFDVWLTS